MSILSIKAILFDLDDTLYDERDFFRSGFGAVAEVLKEHGVANTKNVVALLEHYHHHEGRMGVFQKLASYLDFPQDLIPILVSAFRAHRPNIRLAEDAAVVLPRLRKSFRLGCVTDGWEHVQRAKIEALGLRPMLDAILLADLNGRDFWKPHPRPFLECCEALGVSAGEALFVGDNLERDYMGARACGMDFIRIRRQDCHFGHQQFRVDSSEAVLEIHDLYELEEWLWESSNHTNRPKMASSAETVGIFRLWKPA